MFLLHRPNDEAIRELLSKEKHRPFSFSPANFQTAIFPAGSKIDHHRVRLGTGGRAFEQGAQAIQRWQMFNIGWLQLCWPHAPIEPGSTVGVLAHHFGFWSLNICRIVSVIQEDGRRYGFVYGTLPEHAERGEERFTVERRVDDDSVWYDILAYSQPNQLLSKLGYPIARMLQKKFARDSMAAMIRSVREA